MEIKGTIQKKKNGRGSFSFNSWDNLRLMCDNEKHLIEKISLFYPLKDLDSEIRIFEVEQNEDKTFYFSLEVGMVESLGEQGYNYTFFYEEFPLLEEIKEDIINHYLEQKEDLNNKLLTYREECYLKKINKIKI